MKGFPVRSTSPSVTTDTNARGYIRAATARIALIATVLLLVACAGSATNPADANRNRFATVVASYGSVQSFAETYVWRPPCPTNPGTTLCSDPTTVRRIQAADRAATAAITRTNDAIKANPSDPSLPALIGAAAEAVAQLRAVTPNAPREGT